LKSGCKSCKRPPRRRNELRSPSGLRAPLSPLIASILRRRSPAGLIGRFALLKWRAAAPRPYRIDA
jgi:hypothetical protein